MTTVLLSLLSAVAYGSSDFVGGLVSRRASAWSVAVVLQLASAASALLAALVVGVFLESDPIGADLAWASLAGVGSGAGVGFLFRGLGSGRMAVVAPVSAVGAALLPVGVSLVVDGLPSAAVVVAVVAAVPAIWLVSRGEPEGAEPAVPGARGGLTDGLLAGLGFGVMFVALDQVRDAAGLWPLALTQAVSAVAAATLATVAGADWWPLRRTAWPAAWGGPLGALALLAFLLATQQGSLTVAALISSLYPAATIVLALVVLRERVHRAQVVGLVLCGITVALVAVG